MPAAAYIALFGTGVLLWTFIEYVIHGWLSHILPSPIRAIHAVHHRDPHAVFALGAWPVAALGGSVAVLRWGATSPGAFFTGMLFGFACYEWVHYRLHFVRPASAWERRLRERHLIHHYCDPSVYFGVTTAIWDRLFGTEPTPEQHVRLAIRVCDLPPLAPPSNLGLLFRFK